MNILSIKWRNLQITKNMNDNILGSIQCTLSCEKMNYKKASDFQGVLFTQVESEYVDYLHKEQLHPYSQYIYEENGTWYWKVNTLNTEAYEKLIEPLLKSNFTSFNIANGNIDVEVTKKEVTTRTYDDLMHDFYNRPASKGIDLNIKTYTAFKQRGKYNITPDLRLIFQSLMMKYSMILDNVNMEDEETLEQLFMNSFVSKYRLRSGGFPLEGRVIPGFIGNMSIKYFGSETMMRYIRLLFEFGEYSGIGIKTGMGMGAIAICKEDASDR